MRYRILIVFMIIHAMMQAQDTLTLEQCIASVISNSPHLQDKMLIDEQGMLTDKNLRTAWFPSLSINGKATYQSDVVNFDIDIPGIDIDIPEMPHEQYGLNVDIRQSIYDGGYTSKKRDYEKQRIATEVQKVEVDLNALKERVTSLYFTILLLQENRENLMIALENLKAREHMFLSAVENGVATENDLKIIRVEILKTLQAISEIDAGRKGTLRMLSVYMDSVYDENLNLSWPYLEIPLFDSVVRPELMMFDMQTSTLEAGKKLISVQRMPQVYAFGQGGVGKPGYNMLNDQMDSYFMAGIGITWKIWDWNTTKRNRQIIDKQKAVISNLKESFDINTRAALEKELETIDHLSKTISLDDTMLKMRMEIKENAASKLDNGTISATEYLIVHNDENIVRIKRSTHKMLLMQSIAKYNLLLGTL